MAPGRGGIAKSAVIGGVVALVTLMLMIYASRGLSRHTCEVCLVYQGREACRTADGASVEEARRTAIDLACAGVASGMTDSINCANTPPRSVHCDGEYRQGAR
jgi:hypothetical protein